MKVFKMSYAQAVLKPIVSWKESVGEWEAPYTIRYVTPSARWSTLPQPKATRAPKPRVFKCRRENALDRAFNDYEYFVTLNRVVTKPQFSDKYFSLYLKNKYSPVPLLKQAQARREYAQCSHKIVWENTDIPTGRVVATSRKQQKVRRVIYDALSQLVDEHVPAPSEKVRDILLLQKLRLAILVRRCKEMPTTAKCRYFERFYLNKIDKFLLGKYRKCFCNLCVMRNFCMHYKERHSADGEMFGLTTKVEHSITDESKSFLDKVLEGIKSSVKAGADKIGNTIINSMTAVGGILLTAAVGNNKQSWITGILSSFVVVGVLNTSSLSELLQKFTAGTKKPESASTSAPGEAPAIDAIREAEQSSSIAQGLTLLFQSIGMYCGLAGDAMHRRPDGLGQWSMLFSNNLQKTARNTTGMMSFFRNFIDIIRKILKYIYFKMNPDQCSIIKFWEHSLVLRELIKQIDEVLVMEVHQFAKSDNMALLESSLVLVTEVIVRIGCIDTDANSTALLTYFSGLKTKLVQLRGECQRKGYSATTREVPYSLAVYGTRGIGKSYLLNDLATELSQVAGVSDDVRGKVYSKRIGAKYYDGLLNEEIIVFDDFCQIDTPHPEDSDAKDLFEIITDQPFRPNFAAVEDKGRIVDVKLVMMAMNNAFPKPTFLADCEALWRRRNKLIHVTANRTPGNNDVYDPEFKHLNFFIHPNVTSNDTSGVEAVSYRQLVDILKNDIARFKSAQASKLAIRSERQANFHVVKDRKTPLSVDQLEAAVVQALSVTSSDTTWEKVCGAMKVPKVKEWMRRKLPFLYKDPDTTEADKALDEAIEKGIEKNELNKIKIDENNFQDFLHASAIWDQLSKDQQNQVQECFTKTYPGATFCPPIKAPAQGSITEISDASGPSEHSKKGKKKQEVTRPSDSFRYFEQPANVTIDYNTPLDDDKRKYLVHDANAFFNIPALKFPEIYITPLSYSILRRTVAMGGDYWETTIADIIGRLDHYSGTCEHTQFDTEKFNTFAHCCIDRRSRSFLFINCRAKPEDRDKCIFSNKAVMQGLSLFFPQLIKDVTNFSKNSSSYSHYIKVDAWQKAQLKDDYYTLIKEWCKKAYTSLKPRITSALRWLWKFVKWILLLLTPIFIIVGLLFSFKGWGAAKDEDDPSIKNTISNLKPHVSKQFVDAYETRGRSIFQPYSAISGESGYTMTVRGPSGNKITPARIQPAEARMEDSLLRIFKKATLFIYVTGTDKTTGNHAFMNLRVFKIGGQWLMMPKHYFTFIATLNPDTMLCRVKINNTFRELNFKAFKVLNISNSEMMLVCVDSLERGKDLRNHFAPEEIWNNAPLPSHMRIMEVLPDDTMHVFDLAPKLVKNFGITCYNEVMDTYSEVLNYKWAGEGRCMSLIFDDNMKIRGFHIAGDHRVVGYGAIVTKDLLMELGSLIDPPTIPYVDPDSVASTVIDGAVVTIGKVQAKYIVHQPNQTAIRPSEIHGVFPIRTVPGPLRACALNNFVDPLEAGIAKHGIPTLDFNAEHMRVIEERFTEMLIANVKPYWSDVGVRSIDSAIRGVPGTPGFKSLVLSTSEGFPYMCERSAAASKKWLIHIHEGEDGEVEYSLHKRLVEEYEKNMALRKQGIVPPTVNVDCLKDARLPIEKAYVPGKVRIFSVAPTDFVIAFRQYFADFLVSFTKARFNFFHAVGIAPETIEWTEMINYMTEVGNKFLTGDYKNFGPGFNNAVFKAILRARIKWYEVYNDNVDALQFAEEQLVREIMNIETSEPIHLAHDILYKTFSGMCSGSPSTTIDNCCVNTFYIMLAYFVIMLAHNPRLATLDAMYEHMRLLVYGDDVFICVSDTICEIFNNVTLHNFFKQYKIEYTDADKTGEMRKYVSLQDATFLKRSFVRHPYIKYQILGAIEKRSVEDCANWIRKSADPVSASIEASYAALQLAYGWGPKYFNEVRSILLQAWRKKGIRVTLRTWMDYDRIYNRRDFPMVMAEAQGPPTSTPGESTECEESQDTIIQDHAPPDVDCPKITTNHIAEWAGADFDATYERLVNRYVLLKNFTWKKTDLANTFITLDAEKKIKSVWNLPLDIITKAKNTPTILPFLQHKYANFDMTVKVVANVNKFMVGQLMVAWYYLHNEDAGFKYRQSTYSKSQMLHAVIDAGSSNSVELCIPYKNYRPWLHIAKDDTLGNNAVLGQLAIKVLSQLSVPSTVYNSASVSIYVKFNNANFMGVIPRDIGVGAEGEMMAMLTTMAAGYLMQQMADKNRDKPPVQLPPTHMTPMSSSSLGVGTGCSEPLQAMRLDARGQVPHPDMGDTMMDLYQIAQQKALFTTFSWTNTHNAGSKLWSVPVSPTLPLESFHSETLFTTADKSKTVYGYAVPPVSIVGGMMTYWRGSLVFDFSVVGSQYHTGRLLAVFVPMNVETITLAQAQALPYVVYDIHDERTFSFTTPYISDKPWWPCGYQNGQVDVTPGIGRLFILVLNELIPMDNVAKELQILVYVGAHESMEFAIPRQPTWGLPWNFKYSPSGYVHARPGYSPWYAGTWRNIYGGKTLCLRYGAVSDHVAQFDGLSSGIAGTNGGWFYYTLDENDPNYRTNSKIKINGKDELLLGNVALVPIDVGDGYGLIYLFCCNSGSLSIGPGTPFHKAYDGKEKVDSQYGIWWENESSDYVTGDPVLKQHMVSNSKVRDSSWVVVDTPKAPAQIQICEPSPLVSSTTSGSLLFGEKFNDLKDYSRRYEPLFRVKTTDQQNDNNRSEFSFDCLPAGNALYNDVAFSRFSRDGGQTLAASGFRFYRGSMNYKIFCDTFSSSIWLEHRPDRMFNSKGIRRIALSTWDASQMKDYASVYSPTSVNRTMTINVPFYQAGSLGLLQEPVKEASEYAKRAYTLGELVVHIQRDGMTKNNVITLDIWRAIGDDMRYYGYVGFPLLYNIHQAIESGLLG
nr:polyprotein [Riboviria sp.]